MPPNFGKILIAMGLFLVAAGLAFLLAQRLPFFRGGRLPGDVLYRRGNFTLYFPWVSCLVVSAILTLLFWIFGRR